MAEEININNYKQLRNVKCYQCKESLNIDNVSKDQVYTDNFYLVNMCVLCIEVMRRSLDNPRKSYDQIVFEIDNDGWTREKLKAKEDSEKEIIQ